ncbi:hypothetical protein BKA61DRAFT_692295 [Leptodontidium sp. MPI-SDFR-AT-0119]|nr:hypothetical protein BKA61DRAFT_692295 [Leptodontidium sp. MPI-SDFR-AT-0119]
MHIPQSLIILTLISLSAAQKGRNSSSTSTRSRSDTASARLPRATESLSPTLSTLPPNAALKVSVPPIGVADTVFQRRRDRKTKTTPTAIPSSVPADPLLPREKVDDVDFESLDVRGQIAAEIPPIDSILARNRDSSSGGDADILYARQATATSSKGPRKPKITKPAKLGGGGKKNCTDTSAPKSKFAKSKATKTSAAPNVEARYLSPEEDVADFLYVRQADTSSKAAKKTKVPKAGRSGASKGNGTENAVPKSKSPKSKAAKTTGNAKLPTAQAVPIPTDAPTIPFPTGGATLPLIPTRKASRARSGSSMLTSTALPTTLARRVTDGGIETAE